MQQRDLKSASAIYDKIVTEHWPRVGKHDLLNMVRFLTELCKVGRQSRDPIVQDAISQQVNQFLELLLQLPLRFSSAPQEFRGAGAIESPRLLRWLLFFLEYVGPSPAWINIVHISLTKLNPPQVSQICMLIFIRYAEALQVLNPAEVKKFTSAHTLRITRSNYHAPETGKLLADFIELWTLAEPRLRALNPVSSVAQLKSVPLGIPSQDDLLD